MRLPLALIAAALSCAGREPATTVTLRTDLPSGLFDQVVVEIIDHGSLVPCAACRREFPFAELSERASFSVVHADQPLLVHVLMARGRGRPPRTSASLEVYVALDPAQDTLDIPLSREAVGRPYGSGDQPVLASALPALAAPASATCDFVLDDDEACAPGGVFWLGDPQLELLGGTDREGNDERLVVLSPFAVDAHEVTRREAGARGLLPYPGCSSNLADDAPLVCVTWQQAHDYCAALGKRLPTEAELEYLMGGLRSHRFVWGESEPRCADTIIGGAGCGYDQPRAAGAGRLDQLPLGDRRVFDLIGNVVEWTADRWSGTRGACFAAPVLHDPRCEQASPDLADHRAIKGGGYRLELPYVGAAIRTAVRAGDVDQALGFRCVRSAAR